jgi:hypothetical protein
VQVQKMLSHRAEDECGIPARGLLRSSLESIDKKFSLKSARQMELIPDAGNGHRGSVLWPVVSLGLLAAAWGAFLLTQGYAARLAKRWGPAPEVVDALGRDAYVSRRIIPYLMLVLFLDLIAAGSLAVASRHGWPRVLKVLAVVLLVPTIPLHGLSCLAVGFFAL